MPLRAAPLACSHTHGRFDMDTDGRTGSSAHPGDYSQLNDEQLRSAMRFAEKRLRWVQEEHVELTRAYQGEIDAMRKHLIDRVLTRMISGSPPLSDQQRHDLNAAFKRCAVTADEAARLIRAASRGRAEQIGALTEIEAMALLLRLERQA